MAKKKRKVARQSTSDKKQNTRPIASKPNASQELIRNLFAEVEKQPGNMQARLELAELLNATGLASEICNLLEPVREQAPFDDKKTGGQFNRLLAFGYAHARRFTSAESVIETALRDFPGAIDLWYTLCYVELSIGSLDRAIEVGEKYLAQFESRHVSHEEIGRTCATVKHQAQVLNFVGSAWRGKGEADQALQYYQRAIEVDRKNALAYINLANVRISSGQTAEATDVIKMGITNCGPVPELKMLAEVTRRQFTISACLMVRNEEELLPQCLESIRPWVDEIIVVDTGSTDRTIEIAESYGAKIYHQAWEGSFSKHRNYTIDKATSDWVLIIDADEEMVAEDIPGLLKIMANPVAEIISINVINVYGERKNRAVFLPSVRLFKRELGIHYDGIVHNQIQIPEAVPTVRVNVRLRHHGYDLSEDKMKAKARRSRELLEKQLAQDPNDAFAHFNLGQLIRTGPDETAVERAHEVIEHASKAVALTRPNNPKQRFIHLMSLDQLAWSHFYIKRHDKALQYCDQALKLKPDYLDPLILRGHIYLDMNQFDQAEKSFKAYLDTLASYDMTQEKENLIINHIDSRVVAYYSMACSSLLLGDTSTARDRFMKVLGLDDQYLEANALLGELYLRVNDLEAAEKYLTRQIESGQNMADACMWYGDLCASKQAPDKAESYWLRSLELTATPHPVISRLARHYCNYDRIPELDNLVAAHAGRIAKDPERAKKLAEAISAAGHWQQAAALYELLLVEDQEPEILNDLANCWYKLGNTQEAEKYYKLALDTDCPPTVAYRNLGLTLIAQQCHKEALVRFEQYLDLEPDSFEIQQVTGDVCLYVKDFAQAADHYEKCLRLNPDSSEALHRLSDCYLFMGQKDAAILGYQRVLSRNPSYRPAKDRLQELAVPVSEA